LAIGGDVEYDFGLSDRQRMCAHARIADSDCTAARGRARRGTVRVMVTAAHASVAAAHSSAAATATHPASAHRARATDAVTATAGVTATMLLTGVARVSARRLID